jgi:hypothetical protein
MSLGEGPFCFLLHFLLSSPFFFPLLFNGAYAGRGLKPPPPHQLPPSLLASLAIPKPEVKDSLERVMIRNSEVVLGRG